MYDATSEKWVNGSDGGSSGILVVNIVEEANEAKNTKGSGGGDDPVTPPTYRLDKTWREITTANYAVLKAIDGVDVFYLLMVGQSAYSEQDTTVYAVSFYAPKVSEGYDFTTDSPDGYPVMTEAPRTTRSA